MFEFRIVRGIIEMARKGLSKKIRFEVFKRDQFTCQYCGKKAPDVILHVDHIQPVSKGGTNDLLNLITSCQDCNLGKSNNLLDENSTLEKQRKQMEELQERREQIEMMFEWRKSLKDLKSFSSQYLVDYIENIISPYSLSEKGKSDVLNLIKKFSTDEIFEAIESGEKTYLKYDCDGKLEKESVNQFINKLGGIIIIKRKSPVEGKIHYIKGICKNRFSYWNNSEGLNILKTYTTLLKKHGYSDEDVLSDLENEVISFSKSAKNWSQWKDTMEKWIEDIKNWEVSTEESNENIEMGVEEIMEMAHSRVENVLMFYSLIEYLSKPFEIEGEGDLFVHYINTILCYLENQVKAYKCKDKEEKDFELDNLAPIPPLARDLMPYIRNKIDSDLKYYIDDLSYSYLPKWLEDLYMPSIGITCLKDAILFNDFFEGMKKSL